jgi:hypothetical protein
VKLPEGDDAALIAASALVASWRRNEPCELVQGEATELRMGVLAEIRRRAEEKENKIRRRDLKNWCQFCGHFFEPGALARTDYYGHYFHPTCFDGLSGTGKPGT